MLNEIYKNLKAGMVYGYMVRNVKWPYFHEALYQGTINKNLFCWHHYGSSANKATKDDLDWIIRVIFKTTPEEFVDKYECITWREAASR